MPSKHAPPMVRRWFPALASALRQGQPQILITVVHAQGSVPRDSGARMWVNASTVVDTIGGGQLEWVAIERARHWLALNGMAPHDAVLPDALRGRQACDNQARCEVVRYPLGPRLGQCCGGAVWLLFEWLDTRDAAWVEQAGQALAQGKFWGRPLPLGKGECDVISRPEPTVIVCGAGHVGHAIVQLLGNLPFRVVWLDPRGKWPTDCPDNVRCMQGDEHDVRELPDDAYWLVLTHNHALDLALVDAVLQHRQFRFLGMIGSDTKAARFRSRLAQRYDSQLIDRLHCPLGQLPLRSKLPAVIAVSVVAQLLAIAGA